MKKKVIQLFIGDVVEKSKNYKKKTNNNKKRRSILEKNISSFFGFHPPVLYIKV
jgi:hypothetical protein